MEENKKEQKLSYEELQQKFGELFAQYQKLMKAYQEANKALGARGFEYTSFFLSCLFRVMEHPEMYTEGFVKWGSENIEDALRSFADNAQKGAEDELTKNSGTGEAE